MLQIKWHYKRKIFRVKEYARVSKAGNMKSLAYCYSVKVDAIYLSETSIYFHQTARRYDPEDRPVIATLAPVQHLILLKPMRFRKLVLFSSSAAEVAKEKTLLSATVKLPSHRGRK
jgi:hypothetical protein